MEKLTAVNAIVDPSGSEPVFIFYCKKCGTDATNFRVIYTLEHRVYCQCVSCGTTFNAPD